MGSELWDEDGVRYLDTRNNVAHVGHQNPEVVLAVQKQVATLNTNTRYLHPTIVMLAEKLLQLFPNDKFQKVYFVNSGSEANDLALRLARAHTQSLHTIVLDHAYHGHTYATLQVSPYKFNHSQESILQSNPHIIKVPCPNLYRGLHSNNNRKEEDTNTIMDGYAKNVKDACREVMDRGERLGSFIVEGGMSVAGVILPPSRYMKQCIQAVREAGGVYIADEVQTGLGRLGTCTWAFELSGEVPDIVTIGKPFGNGMPLAAVVTTQEISTSFQTMGVEYFNTFGGNPVCAAAGLAVLNVLESQNLQQHASNVGTYLQSQLQQLQSTLITKKSSSILLIGDIRGSGLFLGVEFIKHNVDSNRVIQPATLETSFLCSVLKEKYHILTSIDGPDNNVLVIKPPMSFSQENSQTFISALEAAILVDLAQTNLSLVTKTPT